MAVTTGGFQHIVCPIDFSKQSRTALRVAAELASRGRGRVTALYVSDPLLDAAAAAAAYDTRTLKAKALRELKQFVSRAALPNVPVECAMAPGAPGPTITAFAERNSATLIVMGSHGLTGPHKWLLGSVAEQVLRKTTVPVLVVPRRMPKGKALAKWPASALVAVDPAEYRATDVKTLRTALAVFGARPTFLHVVRPVAFPSWFRSNQAAAAKDAVAQGALRALAEQVGVKAECKLISGEPADEIAAAAEKGRAGVVVLKLRRGPRFTGPRRGSITYRVAARGSAPVLALP